MIKSNIIGIIKQSKAVVANNKDTIKGTINVAAMPEPKYQEYSGSYKIMPGMEQQTLSVKYKVMMNDLIIGSISYREEIASTGGKIIIIGGE